MTEFCGVQVNDDLLGLLKEIALPMIDDDPREGMEGLCLVTIRDIIEGSLGKQKDDEVLAGLCKHILSSYKHNTWPPPYVFTLDDDDDDDDDDAETVGEEEEEEVEAGVVDQTKQEIEYCGETKETASTGPRNRDDSDDGIKECQKMGESDYSEHMLEEIVRKSEEEERARQERQEEEDRLLAEIFASLDETSQDKRRQQQEEEDADIARQLEAEAVSGAFSNNSAYNGFASEQDTALKMDFATAKQECREWLRNNGSGTLYSQQFADCVVEATFAKHEDAVRASEHPEYLLDPMFMAHICTSLLWKTMSSKVEPCKSALKNEVCYIHKCEKAHYLGHFPCKHWIAPTGCHKYLHKDSFGNRACPFGHDALIFDDDELQQAFNEAAITYQAQGDDQGFGQDYQQFLGELDQDSDSGSGSKAETLVIDEESFPAKLPAGVGAGAGAGTRKKKQSGGSGSGSGREDHVSDLKSAFQFAKPNSTLGTPERAKAGRGCMVKHVTDDDIGSNLHSQEVRVRDFSEGSVTDGYQGSREEMAFHTRRTTQPRGKNKSALASAAIGNMRGAADTMRDRIAELREPCVAAAKERGALFLASQEAFRNGQRAQAKVLAMKGWDADKRFKQTEIKSALEIFYATNADEGTLNSGVIDLHGLYVEEAKIILQSLLCSREGKLRTWMALEVLNHLKIITGAGKHSADGVLKLLPAVKSLLATGGLGRQKLKYSEIHDNAGFAFGLVVDATPLLQNY